MPNPTPPSELTDIVGGGLVPSAADEHLRREHALGNELSRTLEMLDSVAEARVHLSLPSSSMLEGAHGQQPTAAVLLVARSDGKRPDVPAATRLIVAAVPGLTADRLTIEVVPPKTEAAQLVAIGPVLVSESTAPLAKAILGTLLGLVLLLGSALVVRGSRRRAASR